MDNFRSEHKKNVHQRLEANFFSFRRYFAISFSLFGMIYVVIKYNAVLFWHHWAIMSWSVFDLNAICQSI